MATYQITTDDGAVYEIETDEKESPSATSAAMSNLKDVSGAITGSQPVYTNIAKTADQIENAPKEQMKKIKESAKGMIPGDNAASNIAKGTIDLVIPETTSGLAVMGLPLVKVGGKVISAVGDVLTGVAKNAYKGMSETKNAVSEVLASLNKVTGKRKLMLGDATVEALDNADQVMYKHYGDGIQSGIDAAKAKTPDAAIEVTSTMRNLINKIQSGEIDKYTVNSLKRIPGFGDIMAMEELPEKITMPVENVDIALRTINELAGRSTGVLKKPIRDLGVSLLDDASELLPTLKPLKAEYANYKDISSIAKKDLAYERTGAGAGEPYKDIQGKKAILETVGLGNPHLIGEFQNYQNAAKNIKNLKRIAKWTAGTAGAVAAYELGTHH